MCLTLFLGYQNEDFELVKSDDADYLDLNSTSDYEPPLYFSCDEESTSSSSECEDENSCEFDLQTKLRDCAVENNISLDTMENYYVF